ncbi:MAG: lactate racemase domain-containing protein [Spirochaetaceae bacterium]|jgi:nickel-dependent lactate racemase|nr:lactate racemase domain-containing protein [Spirochaetaceae bacterium]
MRVKNPFGAAFSDLIFPENTQIVRMKEPERVSNPAQAIRNALAEPIDSESLALIARTKRRGRKQKDGKSAQAVIVVSDNTRPVPYKGDEGLLLPIIDVLRGEGYGIADILVLIATGTHHDMSLAEIEAMIDPAVLKTGVRVENHQCTNKSLLTFIGSTKRGTEILLDSRYVEADLKIATGLVETHFMAGASGGRKAVCPGLIGEQSTYIFHSVRLLDDPNARDLNLQANPVHEEAVEVAGIAGIDFLVNVTLDNAFHITGIFCGHYLTAHDAAVAHIKKVVEVSAKEADIVVTHAGFVGKNHYQCAKCALACLGILKKGGYLVILADTIDAGNIIGGINYRATVALLTLIGPDNFMKLIKSPDWIFLPEQWQVQMWCKVFEHIPMDHMILYAPQLDASSWQGLPGVNGARFLSAEKNTRSNPACYDGVVQGALEYIHRQTGKKPGEMPVSWICDGPYVIPKT